MGTDAQKGSNVLLTACLGFI